MKYVIHSTDWFSFVTKIEFIRSNNGIKLSYFRMLVKVYLFIVPLQYVNFCIEINNKVHNNLADKEKNE